MKKLFLLLCILGIVLPYYHLINFLILNEGSMEGFFSDIFSTHPMGMISMDLTVAATTFLIFLIYKAVKDKLNITCLLYTSPSPRDATLSRMPSSA